MVESGGSTDVPIGVILAIIGITLPLIVALAVWIVKKVYDVSSSVDVLTAMLTNLANREERHEAEDDKRFTDHSERLRSGGL